MLAFDPMTGEQYLAPAPIDTGINADPAPLTFPGWSDISELVSTATEPIEKIVNPSTYWKTARYQEYATVIADTEAANGIPPDLLARLLYQESRFRADAVGPNTKYGRARGIAQFIPSTAASFNLDPMDPIASIQVAGRYLAQLYASTGSWPLALAAYNWGIGNVTRKGMSAAPSETRNYVAQITADVPIA